MSTTTKSKTFKVTLPGRHGEEVRRINLAADAGLDQLRQECRRLFSLPDDCVWYFKWLDEDGDLVSLTEQSELTDLLAAKSAEPVVRLVVHRVDQPQSQSRRPCHQPQPFPFPLEPFLSQLFGGIAQANPHPPHRGFHGHRPAHCRRPDQSGDGIKARCDVTGSLLSAGQGWYHKPGTNFDVCQAVFDSLPESDKASFVRVDKKEDLGSDAAHYQRPRCPRRRCERTAYTTEVRGWCDATGTPLRVGQGWYHKVGTTFDLSEKPFAALSEEDKGAFVCVNTPEDLGEERPRYAARVPVTPAPPAANATATGETAPEEEFFEQLAAAAADFVDIALKADEEASDDSGERVDPAPAPAPVAPKRLQVEVVNGPSIADGSTVKRGTKLVCVWEVKNTDSDGVWTDVRIQPVGPNPFRAPESGWVVPFLAAGTSGLASVELTVPSDIADGDVAASFQFVDSNGNEFGPALSIRVVVEADRNPEADGVQQLMDMGLGDAVTCLKALRGAKGDVNGAALSLLRSVRK